MNPYIPLFLLFAFAGLVGGGLLVLSHLLGPRKRTAEKELPYECGVTPVGGTRERFPVKFYLPAMLFIVFDIEAVFLYPWAVLFREFLDAGFGMFLFVEMALFLGVLVVGLIYIYRSRALEWE